MELSEVPRLTDAAVKAAKPGKVTKDLYDEAAAGLCIRIHPSSYKAWGLRIRVAGVLRRYSLGEYPTTSLGEARDLAAEMKKAARRGQDPGQVLKPPASAKPNMREAVAVYMETKQGKQSRDKELRRFEIHVLPSLGSKQVDQISKTDIDSVLHSLAFEQSLRVAPNRTFTSLAGFWRWAVFQRGYRPDNPMEGMKRPIRVEPSAERHRNGTTTVLNLDELATLYRMAISLPSSVLPDLLRCLILIPLRREELTGLLWSEVENSGTEDGYSGPLLRIAARRMKARRPAVVPLSRHVATILDLRRRQTGGSTYVFSVPGSTASFAGWSYGIKVLRKYLGSNKIWTIHDIRRSVATGLARDIRVDTEIIKRILQHSDAGLIGVTAAYQRSPRLREQVEALEAWAALIERTATASGGKSGVDCA
jgi:integrase